MSTYGQVARSHEHCLTNCDSPLRWPRWKKHVCFGAVCAFTFLTNYAIGGLSPAFFIISQEYGKTQTETTGLLLWPILVLGVFNFLLGAAGRTTSASDQSSSSHPSCCASATCGVLWRSHLSLCYGAISLPPSLDPPRRRLVPPLSTIYTSYMSAAITWEST